MSEGVGDVEYDLEDVEVFPPDAGDVGLVLDFIGEIYFDVDGLGLSYGEMSLGIGGVLVGDSGTGVGVEVYVCSVGSEEYVGVFGRKKLMSSSCWFSKSSRNSKCTSERLSISSVENVALLLSIAVGTLFVG